MEKLKVLDLFSGIGGFSLGLERTGGFETIAFCEIDEHCQKVLNNHWPFVPIYDDVERLTKNSRYGSSHAPTLEMQGIDIICGGFPCQDISVAGKQKGLINKDNGEATRSGLWFQYKRLIKEIKPKYVIIENVRNLLSNGLGTVLQDLSEIGYDAEWEIISARDVGACHLRERVWIVAYPYCNYLREQSRGIIREGGDHQGESGNDGKTRSSNITHPDDFRFWPTFTSEKEKQFWWAEATSSIRDWWEIESSVCRVDDELSKRLDKGRSQRIKQLGNAVVPAIPQIIGERILYHEAIKWL
jgi:DNA (cytosine-5)-methyltransferase 1